MHANNNASPYGCPICGCKERDMWVYRQPEMRHGYAFRGERICFSCYEWAIYYYEKLDILKEKYALNQPSQGSIVQDRPCRAKPLETCSS